MATQRVAVRLGPEVLARVDAIRPRLPTKGRGAARSEAVRALVLIGLEAADAELAAPTVRATHADGDR
jgi:hypothetical protein